MDSKKAPIRYFIELVPMYRHDCAPVTSLSLENGQIKKEKLVIKASESDGQNVAIMRYPIEANEQLIEEEMEAELEPIFFGSDFGTVGISIDE
jgi:hypothetical protein